MSETLPLPPFEMRQLVGRTYAEDYDNSGGGLVFPEIPYEQQETFFDFGCGCGRTARQLVQQKPRPKRYVGIDLHKGMIRWCEQNLKPLADGFEFIHHDVYHSGFNPDSKEQTLPFPVEDHAFGLVLAWSVFTHLVQEQAVFYLREVARILAGGGTLISTWFTFDKRDFPMMQDHQNALYINIYDPGNAVLYDRMWLKSLIADAGLSIVKIEPPSIRGFWWLIQMTPSTIGLPDVEFPPDVAPAGIARPPDPHKDVSKIGLES